jgi:hypothetical protein
MIEYITHRDYIELKINGKTEGNYDTKEEAHREAMNLGY